MNIRCAGLLAALLLAGCATAPANVYVPPPVPAVATYAVEERSIAELAAEMATGRVSSEQITRAYLARIEQLDRNGPTLRSVLALNPRAIDDARALDAERAQGRVRGPLHGAPVLITDNIETR